MTSRLYILQTGLWGFLMALQGGCELTEPGGRERKGPTQTANCEDGPAKKPLRDLAHK